MEQAINSFNKGLQMDTHPLVQGNDTLSNCLNGTFITMNGNEVILQNDMGNRRVNHAFLPPGYEPVGMKEYGGVIYVASYNPITGNCQVGSFPSPQKRMSSIVGDDKLSIEFKLYEDLSLMIEQNTFSNVLYINNEFNVLEFNFLNSLDKLYIYDNNYPLHIGDKFCLFGNISGLFVKQENSEEYAVPLISKFFNTIEQEGTIIPYAPKNRLFNLEVGILNSENSFIDLSNSLVKWDINGNFIENCKIEEQQNNIGCFIKNINELNGVDSFQDRLFNINREVDENLKNTFQYKLSGPLCLKESINTFNSFNISIRIDYNKEGNTTINGKNVDNQNDIITSISGYFTNLTTAEENTFFDYFDFIGNDGKVLKEFVLKNDAQIQYNEQSNLYTKKQTRVYSQNIDVNDSNSLYKCIVAPKLINNNGVPFGGKNTPKSENQISGNLHLYVTCTTTYNAPDNIPNQNQVEIQQDLNKPGIHGNEIWTFNDNSNDPNSIFNSYNSLKSPIYLPNLCQYFVYDLNKVNSGSIQINGWRTLNKINKKSDSFEGLSLSYSILAYPRYEEIYSNLRLLIVDSDWETDYITEEQLKSKVNNDDKVITIIKRIYNITQDQEKYPNVLIKNINQSEFDIINGVVEFSSDELKKSKLYNVDVIWDVTNEFGDIDTKYFYSDEKEKYWILTTNLFNDSYFSGNPKFIDNFVNPNELYKEIRDNLLIVQPEIFSTLQVVSEKDDIKSNEKSGNVFSTHSEYISKDAIDLNKTLSGEEVSYYEDTNIIEYKTTKETKFSISPNITIDSNIYPESLISINENETKPTPTINVNSINCNNYNIQNLLEIGDSEKLVRNLEEGLITLDPDSDTTFNDWDFTLKFTIKEQLHYEGKGIEDNQNFQNPYLPFKWAFCDNINGYDPRNPPKISSLTMEDGGLWTRPRFVSAGEENEDNPYALQDIYGNIGQRYGDDHASPHEVLGQQYQWPTGGLIIQSTDATTGGYHGWKPILSYSGYGSGEGGSPITCDAYLGSISDYNFYRCTRTEGSAIIIMKNKSNSIAQKIFLLCDPRYNIRLHKVISTYNMWERDKRTLGNGQQVEGARFCESIPFEEGEGLRTLDKVLSALFNYIAHVGITTMDQVYIQAKEPNTIASLITNLKKDKNTTIYCNRYYPNLNRSTYVDLNLDDLENIKITINYTQSINLNNYVIINTNNKRLQFKLNSQNNIEGQYSKTIQSNPISIKMNPNFSYLLNKIKNINGDSGLFNNLLINPIYKELGFTTLLGYEIIKFDSNGEFLNSNDNGCYIKSYSNIYQYMTYSQLSDNRWTILYSDSGKPVFYGDNGAEPSICGSPVMYVGCDKSGQDIYGGDAWSAGLRTGVFMDIEKEIGTGIENNVYGHQSNSNDMWAGNRHDSGWYVPSYRTF